MKNDYEKLISLKYFEFFVLNKIIFLIIFYSELKIITEKFFFETYNFSIVTVS